MIYELRIYSLHVGKLADAVELYRGIGWPALEKHAKDKLVGYFTGDIGAMNQIIHVWKFEDDADRRSFWKAVYADPKFMEFASRFRPLVMTQENKLMMSAPWGPTP